MVLGWFDARNAKAFGSSLAQFFIDRIPLDAQLSDKKFAARTQEVLAKMTLQVRVYRENNKIGFYQKAQLGNAFKWSLKDAGYDDAYIEKLTVWLITALK